MDYRNVALFDKELDLIADFDLQGQVRAYLDECTPDYFWTDGASSSGKYHPSFAHGIGGLVRHTKAVVMFAQELLRMSSYAYMPEEYKDYVIAACLIHDTCKYGFDNEIQKEEYKHHARNAAKGFEDWCKQDNYQPHFLLLNAVRSHMGQWSTEKEDRPFTQVDRCVHLADYMASRSFIDIPTIDYEYNTIIGIENELPF